MKNKVCLITGAASGLGYEFSKLAIDDGFELILIDINTEKLCAVKKELENISDQKVTIISKDLCKQNVANEIFEKIKNDQIDMLINNAGFGLFGKFHETDWELEERMMYLHMMTCTHLTKLVLQKMIRNNKGKILNIASLAAFQPGPFMSIYYASKSFLLSFSEAIANEVKNTGVSITVLCPGPTKTNFQSTVNNTSSKNKLSLYMANAHEVATYGYEALKKKKIIAIPGIFNKVLAFLPRILPRNLVTSIVIKVQTSNRSVSY
jgi:short-subunit dehydrogenase